MYRTYASALPEWHDWTKRWLDEMRLMPKSVFSTKTQTTVWVNPEDRRNFNYLKMKKKKNQFESLVIPGRFGETAVTAF